MLCKGVVSQGEPRFMDSSTPPRRRGRPPKVNSAPTRPADKLVGTSLDDFLGPAPLLEGEDQAGYAGLLEEVRRQVAPKDVIEQIYIRDVVDLTWELMRSRRIKVAILHKGQVRAVHQLASSENLPGLDADARWSVRSAVAKSFSDGVDLLAIYGVTLQDINAHAFVAERETLLRLDQIMMQIEARRNFALREIERRRASLGRRLGAVLNEVEAEPTEVQIDRSPAGPQEV